MTKPTKLIVDCTTGVQTSVELTDEEIAQLSADIAFFETQKAEREAEAEAKAAAKASAEAKLVALGLTVEEIAAL
jgi:hypothetical protein